ncbi:uncharacterized protein LOC133815149 [Humulus lupulus]|uniref:uncharacterized protein LOC133815149 n=1 Tax=Humulus lupulus TaxID=3486 RepID=UPI002B417AF8|nr:uncharacterized protein LOC133815149 [Humulus lupulus]
MYDMLWTKLEEVETVFEIMEQLQEHLGHKSGQACLKATKKYVNARMVSTIHVPDHFIKMANYFQEAELRGAIIDEETHMGFILNSLAPTFLTFTTNYFLNKLNYGMTQLLNGLQMYEAINGGPSKASASKGKKRKQKKTEKAKAPATAKPVGGAAKCAGGAGKRIGAKPSAKKAK